MVKKLTFLSNRHIKLNFRPSYRAYFYLWNDSLWVKIEVKMDEISPKYQNSNKIFTFFQDKHAVFRPFLRYKLYRLGRNWSDPAKPSQRKRSWLLLIKNAQWYLPRIGRYKFIKEKRHLPSECNILTTIAPNLKRLGPLETKHPEISGNIMFKENGAQKCLLTAAWRSDQKTRKRQNSPMRRQKWEAS